MYFSSKIRAIALGLLVSIFSIGTVNADDYDVHGRDLSIWGLGALGHIGIEYNGRMYEMLSNYSRSAYGGSSSLMKMSISSFTSASPYWGDRSPESIYENGTKNRILDTYDIGAKYAYSTGFRSAYSRRINGITVYYPGKYRCDTFVASSLRAGGLNVGFRITPRTVFNQI